MHPQIMHEPGKRLAKATGTATHPLVIAVELRELLPLLLLLARDAALYLRLLPPLCFPPLLEPAPKHQSAFPSLDGCQY